MAARGDKVSATDYNNVRLAMLNILGSGSGDYGYGQTPASASAIFADKVKRTDWDNLRRDIQRIADHQGTSIAIASVTTGTKISASVVNNYLDVVSNVLITNRFNLAIGQYSDETITTSTKSSWNGIIQHNFQLDFGSVDNARYYFNAGGNIRITPTFTPNSNTSINQDWNNIISNVGTIVFSYTNTTISGSQVSSIGYYDLTTSPTQIYIRTGGNINSLYASNDFKVNVYRNSTGSVVYFQVSFEDNKSNNGLIWGVDEPATGSLVNTVISRRPSGSNVNITAPTIAVTSYL